MVFLSFPFELYDLIVIAGPYFHHHSSYGIQTRISTENAKSTLILRSRCLLLNSAGLPTVLFSFLPCQVVRFQIDFTRGEFLF